MRKKEQNIADKREKTNETEIIHKYISHRNQ
jgi:hypothetical protein